HTPPDWVYAPPTQPQAFRVGSRALQKPLGFGKFVNFLRGVLRVAGLRLIPIRRLLLTILGKCRIGDEHHRRAKGGGHKTRPKALHDCPEFVGPCQSVGPPPMETHSVSIAARPLARSD